MKSYVLALALASVCFAPASTTGCSKQQAVNAVNTVVQIAVDVCTEAPQLLPPGTPVGTVVSLLCPSVAAGAPEVQVLIDQIIWDMMKKSYMTQHGSLPKGMTPPGTAPTGTVKQ